MNQRCVAVGILAAVLSSGAVSGQTPVAESRPVSAAEVDAAVKQGLQLLLAKQENYVEGLGVKPRRFKSEDAEKEWEAAQKKKIAEATQKLGPPREWPYEGVYRVGPEIPPGYRVGGSAIVCWALLEAPGFEQDPPRQEAFRRSLAFVMKELDTNPLLQSGFEGTYDVRGWAHTYGLALLLRALERNALPADAKEPAQAMIKKLIKTIEQTEIVKNGGWNYARGGGGTKPASASTFMTPPTLQALFAAKRQGFPVRADVIARALDVLEKARLDNAAFQYGQSEPKRPSPIDTPAGACARMAVCESTLLLGGRGSVDRVRGAVAAFFQNWQFLEDRRQKTGTHEGPYKIAPYFFHYGHTYVAQAIELLPEAERPPLRDQLRALYWKTREADGGWNDRIFERSKGFGTAMALLGLMMPALPAPAAYQAPASR